METYSSINQLLKSEPMAQRPARDLVVGVANGGTSSKRKSGKCGTRTTKAAPPTPHPHTHTHTTTTTTTATATLSHTRARGARHAPYL